MTTTPRSISVADARFVLRLMGELNELRRDPGRCAEHLLAQLAMRTHAEVAGCNRRVAECRAGSVSGSGHLFGASPGQVRHMRQFLEHPMFLSPVSAAAIRTRGPREVVRGHRISTADAPKIQRELYEDYVRSIGIGDSLLCKSDRCAVPGLVGLLWVRKAPGAPRFSDDDAAMVGLLNNALEDWFWPSYTGWLGGPEVRRDILLTNTAARDRDAGPPQRL